MGNTTIKSEGLFRKNLKTISFIKYFLQRDLSKMIPKDNVVGIIGAAGKTTAVRACEKVLDQQFITLTTTGQTDSLADITKTLSLIRPNVDKLILEIGSSLPDDVSKVLYKIKPGVGIALNFSAANLENFGSLKAGFEEIKVFAQNFSNRDLFIINYDDLEMRSLSKETAAEIIFFGTDSKDCHVWADNINDDSFLKFKLNYRVESVEIRTKFLGRHFLYPLLSAAALGITCQLSLFTIKKALESLEPEKHKMEPLEGLNGSFVIDDTYSNLPAALESAINTINSLSGRRRCLVLGEVKGLGTASEQIHRQIAQKIYQQKIDFVLLGGGDCKYIADELLHLGMMPEAVDLNLSNTQMVTRILTVTRRGDIVLVKAAKGNKLEEVVKRITKHD